jgi:hypothetical protein
MTENLILGCATISVNMTVQCIVLAILLRTLVALKRKQIIKPTFVCISTLLSAVLLVILAGNLLQMTLWAGLFFAYNEFADFATAFYHSVVNFSTLGYGDMVMSQKRRLLGGLEAANGVLMFGLTTSFLYSVLSRLVRQALEKHAGIGA